MIIAVTRDNSDLINQVCNTLKHDVQIMNGVTRQAIAITKFYEQYKIYNKLPV